MRSSNLESVCLAARLWGKGDEQVIDKECQIRDVHTAINNHVALLLTAKRCEGDEQVVDEDCQVADVDALSAVAIDVTADANTAAR